MAKIVAANSLTWGSSAFRGLGSYDCHHAYR